MVSSYLRSSGEPAAEDLHQLKPEGFSFHSQQSHAARGSIWVDTADAGIQNMDALAIRFNLFVIVVHRVGIGKTIFLRK